MKDIIQSTNKYVWQWLEYLPGLKETEKVVVRQVTEMFPRQGQSFVRLAGLSGAVAVIMGAYGAHGLYKYSYIVITFFFFIFSPSSVRKNLKCKCSAIIARIWFQYCIIFGM